ncbi:hypothetical protein [Olleya sp. 1-3]|uniref:hypothetical protein n=1 Tax=Olleya sp. 1-3 TaxID=2058323 RepID=UPI000C32A969|nr:hypothetical protein [Olleya sp. 1-3]PKG52279.1 hypothetical protein CXF54_04215 [Olleya sp. 1-3]
MRIKVSVLFILIFATQCKNIEKKDVQERDWDVVKTSRYYRDYATFIQNHPNSNNLENAISEYLFLKDSLSDFIGCNRYNATIDTVNNTKLLFNQSLTTIDSLRHLAFNYLKNANGAMEVSSKLKYKIRIPNTDVFDSISKGQFEFHFYKKHIPVTYLQPLITEISKGINDYKNYLSKKWYQTEYAKLEKNKKIAIDALNDQKLVFFDFTDLEAKRITPPPPASD